MGDAAVPSRRRGALALEVVLVLLAAAVLAVFATWPLATHLRSAEDPFDPRFQAWTIDWVQHAVRHPSHLYAANIFAPEKSTLAYSDSLIGIAVPLLPLRWVGLTPIGVFDMAVMIGFALSAAAGYAFAKVVTGSVAAAAVAGAAFAFGGFGTYESVHVQTVFRPGVAVAAALAWMLADRAAAGGRRLVLPAAGLSAVVAWQCSVSFYSGVFALGAAVIVLAVRGRSLGRRGLVAGACALAVAGAALVVLALPYLGRHAALPGFRWTLSDLRGEGADFLHADSRLAVWGGPVGRNRPWPQFPPPLFPGLTLLLLGLTGAITGWRGNRRSRLTTAAGVTLIVLGAAAAVGASNTGWRQYAPYRLAFEYLPGGQALRATFRAWMIGLLGLGLLAGAGAAAAAGALHRVMRPALATALVASLGVAGVMAEGYRQRTLSPVSTRPVDAVLARMATPGGVLYLPVGGADPATAYLSLLSETDVVYRTTVHHRRTPNGYSGFFPPSYFRMTQTVRSLPGQPGLHYLQSIGVRFVVVHLATAAPTWRALADPTTAAPLTLVGTYDGDLLYAVPAAPAG